MEGSGEFVAWHVIAQEDSITTSSIGLIKTFTKTISTIGLRLVNTPLDMEVAIRLMKSIYPCMTEVKGSRGT